MRPDPGQRGPGPCFSACLGIIISMPEFFSRFSAFPPPGCGFRTVCCPAPVRIPGSGIPAPVLAVCSGRLKQSGPWIRGGHAPGARTAGCRMLPLQQAAPEGLKVLKEGPRLSESARLSEEESSIRLPCSACCFHFVSFFQAVFNFIPDYPGKPRISPALHTLLLQNTHRWSMMIWLEFLPAFLRVHPAAGPLRPRISGCMPDQPEPAPRSAL